MSHAPSQTNVEPPEMLIDRTELINQTPDFAQDQSCIIILDRSGSMTGNLIETTEREIGAFSLAFEEFGGSISIIDMFNDEVRRIASFNTPISDATTDLYTGEASGPTPLTDALNNAQQQVETREDTPFILVVSDGRPNDAPAYIEALKASSTPVYGVIFQELVEDEQEYPTWLSNQLPVYTNACVTEMPAALSMLLERFSRFNSLEDTE